MFLILFGALVAVYTGTYAYQKLKIEKNGVNVQATIEESVPNAARDSYRVMLKYETLTNRTVRDFFDSPEGYWHGRKKGQQVKIRYSIVNPAEYYVFDIEDSNYTFVIIGIALFFSGILMFIIYAKQVLWKKFDLDDLEGST